MKRKMSPAMYSEITPFVRLLEETQKVHVKVNNKTITFYN